MKKNNFFILSLSAANAAIFLLLNIAYPTAYFVPDGWYKLFYGFSIVLVLLFWLFLIFIQYVIYKKCKKIGTAIYLFLGSIFPYYTFYIAFTVMQNKPYFYGHFKLFSFLSVFIIFAFYFLFKLLKKTDSFKKCVFVFLTIIFPFVFFTIGTSLYNIFFEGEKINDSFHGEGHSDKQKIIWIVFDELDKQIIFDLDPEKINLKGFKELKRMSFYAENMTPSGLCTDTAIPSLTTGLIVNDFKPFNRDTFYIYTGDKKLSWKDEYNIFKFGKELDYKTACLGWNHPYRRLFNQDLDFCYDHLTIIKNNSLSQTISLFPTICKHFINKISPHYLDNQDYLIQKYQDFYDETISILNHNIFDFLYIHWPFPHNPAVYDLKGIEYDRTQRGYLNNILICDALIDDFIKNPEHENTILIVTSDHHLRHRQIDEDENSFTYSVNKQIEKSDKKLVPFFVKMPNENGSYIYNEKINAVVIPFLIKKIMQGKIKNYSDIDNYMANFTHANDLKSD